MLTLLIVLFILTMISFFIMIYLMVSDTIFTKKKEKRDKYKKKLEDRVDKSLFIYMEESIKHDTPIDDNFINELKDAGKRMVNAEMSIYDEKQRRLHH